MSIHRSWARLLVSAVAVSFVVSGCSAITVPRLTTTPVAANVVANGTENGATGGSTNTSSGATTSGSANIPSNSTDNTGSNVSASNAPGTTNSTPAPTSSQDLVAYSGAFQHIFFHPLIAFPSVTFNPNDPELKGFNDYFVTVTEFDEMLNLLYQRNYILVNINSLYTETVVNGKTYVHKKTLMLPKGKIPLVLSIDDMNYYPYMQQWGTVQKLVLDANGNVAALSKFPDGHTAVTYDNAIVPIIDNFVKDHPDFSLDGAKGMINLTGYAGVLGYRTNDTTAKDYAQVKAQAEQVIARLKATGWYFASHSWGHLDDATISYQTFVEDTNKWMQQVEPLVGPTQVYVYPFGSGVATNSPKFQYLIKEGFHVLCGVGPTTYVQWTSEALMMDRRHMDGVALALQRKDLNDLFGSADILDPVRPKNY